MTEMMNRSFCHSFLHTLQGSEIGNFIKEMPTHFRRFLTLINVLMTNVSSIPFSASYTYGVLLMEESRANQL